MMLKTGLHASYCSKNSELQNWYQKQLSAFPIPIYSSYDIRDAGFKIANVDANIFPAGFNNICPTDRDSSVELFREFVKGHYGAKVQRILVVTEQHTNNSYYWENVSAIQDMLERAGFQVRLAFPTELVSPLTLRSASGRELLVHSGASDSDSFRSFSPDLVISNNDFSEAHEEWGQNLRLPVAPPRQLGWYQRKKSRYFHHYNALAAEFAQQCNISPFFLQVRTEEFDNFDITDEDSVQILAKRVDQLIEEISKEHREHKIDETPFVFVKNNSGTYGLGVTRVASGADVLEWNYKVRKKMKAAKGGRELSSVILQEGITTRVQAEGATAEPVIYMIGGELAGGFLRTHSEKSATESLNSPGAVFKKLCVSDLLVSQTNSPLENVYGWSARLGLLAIAREAQEMGVEFQGYQ